MSEKTGDYTIDVNALEAEVDRLRADLADARRERDLLRGQLDYCLETVSDAAKAALSAGGGDPAEGGGGGLA